MNNFHSVIRFQVILSNTNNFHLYDFKYSNKIQIIFTQLYGFKYSYLIHMTFTQLYGFKYSNVKQIIFTRMVLSIPILCK